MNIARAEPKAAIEAAHKRGIKVTGHLCSVTYKEAAELGIDDLEHGFFVNTQLDSEKELDECTKSAGSETLARIDAASPEAKRPDRHTDPTSCGNYLHTSRIRR